MSYSQEDYNRDFEHARRTCNKHRELLLQVLPGKAALFFNDKVFFYDSEDEAVSDGYRKRGLRAFLVWKVEPPIGDPLSRVFPLGHALT